jgi:hypothetical protein
MEEEEVKTAALSAVAQLYDILLPRWKGVVLTVEAKLEAERMKEGDVSDTSLPCANIKFSRVSEVDMYPIVPWEGAKVILCVCKMDVFFKFCAFLLLVRFSWWFLLNLSKLGT